MDDEPIIKVNNLTKTFKVIKRRPGFVGALKTLFSADYLDVKAVDGVSFEIEPGELIGYLGPNGAGKSTTIKMLTGILHPTEGEVVVDGVTPYKNRKRNSKNIGVVFGQRSQMVWDLPPIDTYELMRRMYAIPTHQYQANLAQFTKLLGLEELLNLPVRQLSLGQRMRCELVVALLHNPKIVYLDEPTIGLDSVSKQKIREFILQINREQGTTILLTTHDLSDIEKLCKRVLIIRQGNIICDGQLSDIKKIYRSLRRLIFTPLESSHLNGLDKLVRSLGEEIQVDFREDRTVVISFDPRKVSTSELTKQVVNVYDVKDLSIEEAELETIIRDIYETGKVS